MSEQAPFPRTISLDGDWDFFYSPRDESDAAPAMPDFETCQLATMPVPGYWDDHLKSLMNTPWWFKAKFNPDYYPLDWHWCDDSNTPDATTPYLYGVGWYRKLIVAPNDWQGSRVTLHVGGVRTEAWAWLNGRLVSYHHGHSTPFDVDLSDAMQPGQTNELVIAVANTRKDRMSIDLRGWKGQTGGIYRTTHLEIAGAVRVASCYVYPTDDNRKLNWNVELGGEVPKRAQLAWSITDPNSGQTVASGKTDATGPKVAWTTESFDMQPWSGRNPRLYDIEVKLACDDVTWDVRRQRFGLRRLEADGMGLRLNGRPVYLRGVCDHSYYPETCTPPVDKSYYYERMTRAKALGFNWLRFHTVTPPEECLQAADELGMVVQVETPAGFAEAEWIDIVRTCRTHPSVVIYCCGNEEHLDDEFIEFLAKMSDIQHALAPDALFNPHEAMRGVEYGWSWGGHDLKQQMGEDFVTDPYPHNPRRLERLKEFSDVFGQYTWGHLSYDCHLANPERIDGRLAAYERPCLSHENGIIGNYLNIDLEHRYEGTRIGAEIFSNLRRQLAQADMLDRASLYYHCSCATQRTIRKQNVEATRRCRLMTGYDFLGLNDCHWHRMGYPCGIVNEFYEMKPGETPADVLKYNAESVLLLDHTVYRNFVMGQTFTMDVQASLFGAAPLESGRLTWLLKDDRGCIQARGEAQVSNVANGGVQTLATIETQIPQLPNAAGLTLVARLSGGEYELENDWNFWAFPETPAPDLTPGDSNGVRTVQSIDRETLEYLADGGRVLLSGTEPFPAVDMRFRPNSAGRLEGHYGTVVADHPLMSTFPHDGFCDWQFYSLLEGSKAAILDDFDAPFEPIMEFISSPKRVRKQAGLFEYRVGKGRLLVCTLNLAADDVAARHLAARIMQYAAGEAFQPRHEISVEQIAECFAKQTKVFESTDVNRAFDPNAQL